MPKSTSHLMGFPDEPYRAPIIARTEQAGRNLVDHLAAASRDRGWNEHRFQVRPEAEKCYTQHEADTAADSQRARHAAQDLRETITWLWQQIEALRAERYEEPPE
jgi:hypothetical protein